MKCIRDQNKYKKQNKNITILRSFDPQDMMKVYYYVINAT